MNQADALPLCAARMLCYKILHTIFGGKPSVTALGIAASDVAADAFSLLLADVDADLVESFTVSVASAASDPAEAEGDYMRLVGGPGKLAAPPWESVYVTGERMLMQACTLEVRNAYRSSGFIPAMYPHVADDHIALELGFMAALASRATAALEPDDAERAAEELRRSADFLDRHLAKWSTPYAADLAAASRGGLFFHAANLLQKIVSRDRILLKELSSRLEG